MEMDTRILISENRLKAETDVIRMRCLKGDIDSKIIPAFEDLNIGEITTELLLDCLQGGAMVEEMIRKQAIKDVKPIRSPGIKSIMLEKIESVISGFKDLCINTGSNENTIMLPYIIVEKGCVTYVPDAEEKINEAAREYIETDNEKALYDALNLICDGYNQFTQNMGEFAAKKFNFGNILFQMIKVNKDGKYYPSSETDIKLLAR